MTALPGSPEGADVHVAAEIRAVLRSKPEPEKFARELLSDAKTMGSILNAPAFLSGMSEEALERLRTAALLALHPDEIAEVEQLEAAERHARDAVELARERIAKRAGIIK